MAIFDGLYKWDGTKKGGQDPIAWSPGAYELKIFRLQSPFKKVQYLKPYLCIYSATGEGQSISAQPEKFARQVCDDFSLEMDKVLWVEDLLRDYRRYEIITFRRTGKVGDNVFYTSRKRPAGRREKSLIEMELSGLLRKVQ